MSPYRSLGILSRSRVQLARQLVPSAQRRLIASHLHPQQSSTVLVIESRIDTSTAEFKQNAQSMRELITELEKLHATAALGGSENARDKHIKRGKMLVRE
jgi:3-methylcrotonyl-CoA carboxylase beta subunit